MSDRPIGSPDLKGVKQFNPYEGITQAEPFDDERDEIVEQTVRTISETFCPRCHAAADEHVGWESAVEKFGVVQAAARVASVLLRWIDRRLGDDLRDHPKDPEPAGQRQGAS